MKNVMQLTGDVDEFGYIVMIKLKFFELEKMLNVIEISCDEIIHCNNMITFIDKLVAQMRTQEPGAACYENFFCHSELIVEKLSSCILSFVIMLVCSAGYMFQPFFILQIPVNCFTQSLFKCNGWFPAQFFIDLCCIDRISPVMTRPVFYISDECFIFSV